MTTSRAAHLRRTPPPPRADVVVIGAGFGGLGAALRLAELGARVVVCESLGYPGGCASTFSRGGRRYEAGATLFSGFGPGQLFRGWIDRHGLDVAIDWLDPVLVQRTAAGELAIPRDREAFQATLTALPGAPRAGLARFLELQRRVADLLWSTLDDPALLPPFGPAALARHAARLPRYALLAPLVGRPLTDVLRRHGLADFLPFRTLVDALCQITVQCPAAEAEAPLALATLDYAFRGTGHVRGGIGHLAHGLLDAIEARGGAVRLSTRVRGLARAADGTWRVDTRRGPIHAPHVIANLLPTDLARLTGDDAPATPRLDALAGEVATGWGAAMLYLALRGSSDAGGPRHLDLVDDPRAPLIEGNHVFLSIGAPDPPTGARTATASTHVHPRETAADPLPAAAYVERVHARMRQTLARRAPEWWARREHELTASPRTFERFTGRDQGFVGGVPRRAGLHNYRRLVPRPLAPGLWLVGDSVFPGQSTLATALGGVKLAERLVARAGPLRDAPHPPLELP